MNKANDINFSNNDSKILQGIAAILMLCLHLFSNPLFVDSSIEWHGLFWINNSFEKISGEFGLICISIYCFITGYGWRKSIEYKKTLDFIKKHVISIYIGYWIVLSVLLIFVKIFNVHPVFSKFENVNLILEYFCFEQKICFLSWYIIFYACCVLMYSKLYSYFDSKRITLVTTFGCFILHILSWILFKQFEIAETNVIYMLINKLTLYFPTIAIGSCISNFDGINKMLACKKSYFSVKSAVLYILGTYAIYVFCYHVIKQQKIALFLFSFLVPLFVFSILKIRYTINLKHIYGILKFIGEKSLFYWLLQVLPFYTFFQKVFYFPGYSVLILFFSIILLTPFVVICSKLKDLIIKAIY